MSSLKPTSSALIPVSAILGSQHALSAKNKAFFDRAINVFSPAIRSFAERIPKSGPEYDTRLESYLIELKEFDDRMSSDLNMMDSLDQRDQKRLIHMVRLAYPEFLLEIEAEIRDAIDSIWHGFIGECINRYYCGNRVFNLADVLHDMYCYFFDMILSDEEAVEVRKLLHNLLPQVLTSSFMTPDQDQAFEIIYQSDRSRIIVRRVSLEMLETWYYF